MPISLEPIDPSYQNLKLMHSWRFAPATCHYSFDSHQKCLDLFCKEFLEKYHSIPSLSPLFVIYENQKVGVVYFSKWFKEDVCELSIYLDPKQQAKRIGSKALKKALEMLVRSPLREVIAFCKPTNTQACHLFLKAGFAGPLDVQVPKHGSLHPAKKFTYSLIDSAKERVFIIGEAGSNFSLGDASRSLCLAKTMIEEAYLAGCNAVKFQLYHKQRVYAPKAGSPGYLNKDIHEIFSQYALPPDFVPLLAQHANYVGIEFMCSFFSKEDFKILDPYVKRHKIASYEIRHLRLIECAAQCKKPLYLSTGASTLEDIQWAIETFKKSGGQELTLLHCTAQYPAASNSLNLNCIPSLRKQFQLPIGLSDHSAHPLYAPIAATSLGAVAIEKHFTICSKLPGPDHFFAIDCKELKEMCLAIRETEQILGVAKKEIFHQEEELAHFARRGLQAISKIAAGETLKEDGNIAILRPGNNRLGLHPKYLEEMVGKVATRDIVKGQGIQYQDVLW